MSFGWRVVILPPKSWQFQLDAEEQATQCFPLLVAFSLQRNLVHANSANSNNTINNKLVFEAQQPGDGITPGACKENLLLSVAAAAATTHSLTRSLPSTTY
ncbi:unnamed protein product [Ceratitis capitata]|uniref:(Mediterranean fruit fly) hypothetical protein n=1 Tax=Ceratitis capitata TaxID=7213 RepID=A0A811U2W6_CERCA|nr:unnamed protein product [Ceratitis capitata]